MNRMKKTIGLFAGTILVVLGTISAVNVIRTVRAQQLRYVPLTLSQTTTETGSNGNTFTEVKTIAVRDDGSRVEVRESVNGKKIGWLKTVYDGVEGKRVVVDQHTESKTTYLLAQKQWRALTSPPQACSASANPEKGRMLGYDVVKVTYDDPPSVPDPKLHREQWLAVSLNCIPLRESAYVTMGSTVLSRKEIVATSVQPGVPDARLFDIPATFVERAPSEVFIEADRKAGKEPCLPCKTKNSETLDKAYTSHQQRRP